MAYGRFCHLMGPAHWALGRTAVIGGSLCWTRKNLIGSVNPFELSLSSAVTRVVVGMILLSKASKRLPYLLLSSPLAYLKNFIVLVPPGGVLF